LNIRAVEDSNNLSDDIDFGIQIFDIFIKSIDLSSAEVVVVLKSFGEGGELIVPVLKIVNKFTDLRFK